jgi:guanosine-3',5'-bis(diphosphate) 3'-pyrophosphohydrolase
MEAELRRLATTYFNATILDTSGLEDEKCSNQLLDRILAGMPTAVAVEIEPDLLWQRGAKMAARFHLGQLRKDGKTPYIAHPMRVSLTLQRIFGVSDPSILTAALLHDLIEDTTADYDDIQEACGDDIARMVATLTKNSCLPEEQREPAFHEQLLAGDWRTKLVKIADVYDNLCDSRESLAKVNVWERAKLALELAGEDPRLARAAQALRELMASFPENA